MGQQFNDDKMGSVTVPKRSGSYIEFKDEQAYLLTRSNDAKFKLASVERGEPIKATAYPPTKDKQGVVSCADNSFRGFSTFGMARHEVNAMANVVESVTREQILTFLARHPDIARQLRASNYPLTVMNGRPATLAELEKAPPKFRACPADKSDTIVESR